MSWKEVLSEVIAGAVSTAAQAILGLLQHKDDGAAERIASAAAQAALKQTEAELLKKIAVAEIPDIMKDLYRQVSDGMRKVLNTPASHPDLIRYEVVTPEEMERARCKCIVLSETDVMRSITGDHHDKTCPLYAPVKY